MELKIKLNSEEEYENLIILVLINSLNLGDLHTTSERAKSIENTSEKVLDQIYKQPWEDNDRI